MAEIMTPNHRPQIATVRHKVMSAPQRNNKITGEIIFCNMSKDRLSSRIKVLSAARKEKVTGISDADAIVVAGRGIKSQRDMNIVEELAEILEGQLAVTRPLIEAGWGDARRQIGLSGRTVRPKLIITCGVSGSVQFRAGMSNSECIIAINTDRKAPIFDIAHYGIVGDLYQVIPKLIRKIKGEVCSDELQKN